MEELAQAKVLPQLFPFAHSKAVGTASHWRRHGVDFIVHDDIQNEKLLVEVKADRQDTGNIVIETHTDRYDGDRTLGWLYTSKADYLLYIFVRLGRYHIIEMAKLRYLLQQTEHGFAQKSTNNPWGITYFYVIPVTWLRQHFAEHAFPRKEWAAWLD